jgi:SAM-dependent methyltransferase
VAAIEHRPPSQHLIEIRRNKEAWERKPLLRTVYSAFYARVRENLAPGPGLIVELGSGIGAVKAFIPECITTDIFNNPWIDRRENAYSLSFQAGTVSNLILLDVFHHLQFPGTALAEFWRVLADGGRVILLEPGMGVLGKFIYGLFHHEPVGLRKPIRWLAPRGFDPENAGYYAAQANATRVFLDREFPDELGPWRIVQVRQLPEFAYVASGGFSKPQLYPRAILPWVRKIENVFARWPRFSTTRLFIIVEKKKDHSDN